MTLTYLTIGHISRDITPQGPRLGGTVTFSALMAAALGCDVRILTSASPAERDLLMPLRRCDQHIVPSPTPTSFQNIYAKGERQQNLLSRAASLRPSDLPAVWAASDIVHIAPIAQEVTPDLLHAVAPDALRIVTPQGYMRQWSAAGVVSYTAWGAADDVLPHTDAVIFSIEDVQHDETAAQHLLHAAPIGVVTRAEKGAELLIDSHDAHRVPAPPVTVEDPTGAGDIFAASFAVRLLQTGDPLRAAQFATHLASDSVTRSGLNAIPARTTIQEAYSQF
jgi:sugar/nucleoside kinase (ribokinase family)